jgi:hypothetical protein
VIVDEQLLREGEPIADVVTQYLDDSGASAVALRSPIRFEFAPNAAGDNHPAAHLTLNESHCRIACAAPMHPYRFLDFVYRQFYPDLRSAQEAWFSAAAGRLLGRNALTDADRDLPHMSWQVHGEIAAA